MVLRRVFQASLELCLFRASAATAKSTLRLTDLTTNANENVAKMWSSLRAPDTHQRKNLRSAAASYHSKMHLLGGALSGRALQEDKPSNQSQGFSYR
jgi:hypothetical protein